MRWRALCGLLVAGGCGRAGFQEPPASALSGDFALMTGGDPFRPPRGDFTGGDVAGGDVARGDTNSPPAGDDNGPAPGDSNGPPLGDLRPPSGDTTRPPSDAVAPPLAGDHPVGTWFGIGPSEPGPRTVRGEGSASGGGVSAGPFFSFAGDVEVDGADDIHVLYTMLASFGYLVPAPDNVAIRTYNSTGASTVTTLPPLPMGMSVPLFILSDARFNSALNPGVAWSDFFGGSDVFFVQWDGIAWTELAGSGSGSGLGLGGGPPRLAFDTSDRPMVAWVDGSNGLVVQAWTGTMWASLPALPLTNGSSIALAVNGADEPVVTWEDDANGEYEIYVARYTTSSWMGFAGSNGGNGISNTPTVASRDPVLDLDPGDNPWVAWGDELGSAIRVRFAYFDGSTWQQLSGSSTLGVVDIPMATQVTYAVSVAPTGEVIIPWATSEGGPMPQSGVAWHAGTWLDRSTGMPPLNAGDLFPLDGATFELAYTAAGEPVMAWDQLGSVNANVFMQVYQGGAWQELGRTNTGRGLSASDVHSVRPRIEIDPLGRPVVAWIEYDDFGTDTVIVQRFDGLSWQEVGAPPVADTFVFGLRLDIDPLSNEPVVATAELGGMGFVAQVYRFDGGQWTPLPALDVSEIEGARLDFRLDGRGRPVVAWPSVNSMAMTTSIYLRRFEAGWQEIGGSGTGSGIATSTDDPESITLGLDVDSKDRPYVAWYTFDGIAALGAVYLRFWDGIAWAQIAGSATGGGVSGSLDFPYASPAVTVSSADEPWVTFTEVNMMTGVASHHVEHYDGFAWQSEAAVTGAILFPFFLSAADLGLSDQRALTFDEQGKPYFAWVDGSASAEVYVAEIASMAWIDLDGSASGGGVTNSDAPSIFPALSATSRAVCVAWSEPANYQEAFMRCFQP